MKQFRKFLCGVMLTSFVIIGSVSVFAAVPPSGSGGDGGGKVPDFSLNFTFTFFVNIHVVLQDKVSYNISVFDMSNNTLQDIRLHIITRKGENATMKNKFIAMLTITTMTLSLLVGCGQPATPNTNEDTSTEQNTEVDESGDDVVVEPTEEPIEEPTTEPEVEEPVVEPTEEPTTEDGESEFYSDSYRWVFPEGLDGFTDKFVLASDETMSFNCTHYVDPNGNEMNFTWVGPTVLGESAGLGSNGTTIILGNSSDEYALRAFTTGEISPESYDNIASYDKETILSVAPPDAPYPTNGYYEANPGDTYSSFTFEVVGETHRGYYHIIADKEKGLCYQFVYLESIEIYDDSRAMDVINSLDFWDYIPEE